MRQTIRRKRHKVKKDRLFTILAFFVVAPIISVLLGFVLVKYMILPRFLPVQKEPTSQIIQDDISNSDDTNFQQNMQDEDNSEQSTQNQNIQLKQSKLEGITLYNIQAGNFSSVENAESLVKELATNGITGYIVKLDSYKVFTGTYFNREEADKYLSKVKNTYSDSFVNTFSIIERVISYNEDELNFANNLIDTIYAFDDVYNEELSLWRKAVETKETKLLVDSVASNSDNLEKMLQKIDVELKSEQLIQTREKLKNHIAQRKKIIEDLKNNTEEFIDKSYTDFYSNYFDYVIFTKSELGN
ncbi:SPOR domain-containing protein [Brassicibacter mesophilus]|uniref:SPOR domain-containing protein n=1 Tax=Brassicibacter mesophilus TaxID=745119 RepID=UPI003D1EEBEE